MDFASFAVTGVIVTTLVILAAISYLLEQLRIDVGWDFARGGHALIRRNGWHARFEGVSLALPKQLGGTSADGIWVVIKQCDIQVNIAKIMDRLGPQSRKQAQSVPRSAAASGLLRSLLATCSAQLQRVSPPQLRLSRVTASIDDKKTQIDAKAADLEISQIFGSRSSRRLKAAVSKVDIRYHAKSSPPLAASIQLKHSQSQSAAVQAYFQLDTTPSNAREAHFELGLHAQLCCKLHLQPEHCPAPVLGRDQAPTSPRSSQQAKGPFIQAEFTTVDDPLVIRGRQAGNHTAGAWQLASADGTLSASVKAGPSKRAQASLHSPSLRLGIQRADSAHHVDCSWGQVTCSIAAGDEEIGNRETPVTTLSSSGGEASLKLLPTSLARGAEHVSGMCAEFDCMLQELKLTSKLLHTSCYGTFGQWLYDMKTLRRIFKSGPSLPAVHAESVAETAGGGSALLPQWLLLQGQVQWRSLECTSVAPSSNSAASLPTVSLSSTSGRAQLLPVRGDVVFESADAARSDTAQGANGQGTTALSGLQSILQADELECVRSCSLGDVLQLRLSASSGHTQLSLRHTASVEPVTIAAADDLVAALTVVAFTPALKSVAEFRKVLSWETCSGLLLPAPRESTRTVHTVTNAAPTIVSIGSKLSVAHLQVNMHAGLLPSLRRLAPLFGQLSPSSWEASGGAAQTWFNKLARSMRTNSQILVQTLQVQLPAGGRVQASDVEVATRHVQGAVFALQGQGKQLLLHTAHTEYVRLQAVHVGWQLHDMIARSTSHGWLPHPAETLAEYLQRTSVSELHSQVHVRIDPADEITPPVVIYVAEASAAQAAAAMREWLQSASEETEKLRVAVNTSRSSSSDPALNFQVSSSCIRIQAPRLAQSAAPSVGIQLAPRSGAPASPCCTLNNFETVWGSSPRTFSTEPMLKTSADEVVLFNLQVPDASQLRSDAAESSFAQCKLPAHCWLVSHKMLQHMLLSAFDTEPWSDTAASSASQWPLVQRDVVPLAAVTEASAQYSTSRGRNLSIAGTRTRAVYSNWSLLCYREWVMSAIQVYRAMRGPTPASPAAGQSTSEHPSADEMNSFTWMCHLSEVQAILYSSRESPQAPVFGGHVSRSVGCLRLETPELQIGNKVALQAQRSGHQSTSAAVRLPFSQRLDSAASQLRPFTGARLNIPADDDSVSSSALPTPSTGAAEAQHFDGDLGGASGPAEVPTATSYSPSRACNTRLPRARPKAAEREHAIHFGASSIQAVYIAPGTAVQLRKGSASSAKFVDHELTRDQSDLSVSRLPWQTAESPRARTNSSAGTFLSFETGMTALGGASTERLILHHADLYVGVGLKSLSLIDNFKLLHGSDDLTASTRVTVDVSAAQIDCSIDEISELVRVLKVSLAQQSATSTGRTQQGGIDFMRNIAIFVKSAEIQVVDSHSEGRKISLRLNEVDITSKLRVMAPASIGAAASWKHSLRVALGWLHATYNETFALSGGGGSAVNGAPNDELLVGGCFLGETPATEDPTPLMASVSATLQGADEHRRTEIVEASVHVFPGVEAALIVNVDPRRVDFLRDVADAAVDVDETHGGRQAAEARLLGPKSSHAVKQQQSSPTFGASDEQSGAQSVYDVRLLQIARTAAVVSAHGFLRKPLRQLLVELQPFHLSDVHSQTKKSIVANMSEFYTGQVWDYVPRVLKKSVLPNFKAPFTPQKMALKREQRLQRFTPWQPDGRADSFVHVDSATEHASGQEQRTFGSTAESESARKAVRELLGI